MQSMKDLTFYNYASDVNPFYWNFVCKDHGF